MLKRKNTIEQLADQPSTVQTQQLQFVGPPLFNINQSHHPNQFTITKETSTGHHHLKLQPTHQEFTVNY